MSARLATVGPAMAAFGVAFALGYFHQDYQQAQLGLQQAVRVCGGLRAHGNGQNGFPHVTNAEIQVN
jgi:hypothetical protein